MSDYSDTEVYGEAGEDGRPANIPEKFWTPGEGESPASIDVGSLLKTHNHLATTIGAADGYIGAPDAFVLPDAPDMPEGVDYKLEADDPLVEWFQGFAAEKNLSQKMYSEVISGFMQQQGALQKASMDARQAELDALGVNGKGAELIAAFTQQAENWMKDVPEGERAALKEGMADALTSANAYKFVKFMEARMQPSKLPGSDDLGGNALTLDDINKMQTEVYTEGPFEGQRKYEKDPKFRDKVNALRAQVLGS